ncbi:MAG: ferritin-like domain-containing protein [Magnetococcales bacterium]|nr:ferritin-like domain-containing protein [Magnetococcales bacterium]
MPEIKTFEDAIRFAIYHEEEEAEFYESMASRSQSEDQKRIMLGQAAEERDHKRRLEAILAKGKLPIPSGVVADPDLKIAETLKVVDRGGALSYEEALILSAQREKQAVRFYKVLAQSAPSQELADVFNFLAEQELKHGKQIEQRYDDTQRED